jgi:cell wall assembly regulator SMI1
MLIHDAPGGLEEARLQKVEEDLGAALPEDYRAFLREHNGGSPDPGGFVFADAKGPYTDSVVAWFFGIHDEEFNNLEEFRADYRGRLLDDFVPIALDPFGNLICLGVRGEARGKVYFWDHEEETDPPSFANMNRVANSFSEFVSGLRDA